MSAPTKAALRAARKLRIKIHNLHDGKDKRAEVWPNHAENEDNAKWLDSVTPDDATIIDRETHLPELVGALTMIARSNEFAGGTTVKELRRIAHDALALIEKGNQ